MAQVDDLSAVLASVAAGVDALQAKADKLLADLEELQNNTPAETDLSAVIAQAQAISDDLAGTAAVVEDAPTEPPADEA